MIGFLILLWHRSKSICLHRSFMVSCQLAFTWDATMANCIADSYLIVGMLCGIQEVATLA